MTGTPGHQTRNGKENPIGLFLPFKNESTDRFISDYKRFWPHYKPPARFVRSGSALTSSSPDRYEKFAIFFQVASGYGAGTVKTTYRTTRRPPGELIHAREIVDSAPHFVLGPRSGSGAPAVARLDSRARCVGHTTCGIFGPAAGSAIAWSRHAGDGGTWGRRADPHRAGSHPATHHPSLSGSTTFANLRWADG